MRLRITISLKIWLTTVVLVIAVIIASVISASQFRKIRELNRTISETYIPSIFSLTDLEIIIHHFEDVRAAAMMRDSSATKAASEKLEQIRYIDLPGISSRLNRISTGWSDRDQAEYHRLSEMIADSLEVLHEKLIYSSREEQQRLTAVIGATTRSVDEGLARLKNKYESLSANTINAIEEKYDAAIGNLIIMGIVVSLIALFIALMLNRSLLQPVNRFKRILQEMATGKLPGDNIPEGTDEIGQMGIALNSHVGGLIALSNFSEEIGKGNFDSKFQPLSENDTLGNALIKMREELKKAAQEEEKRKEEDAKRNWSNQGYAKFSDILREHMEDLEQLSESVIKHLVKYIDARIGAMFLLDETQGKQRLVLAATYAFDRMKYLKKDVEPGEGLAGRCLQEGETIYITEVPADYIRIRSGLGESKPGSILIVPLKLHEEVYGVMELASLEEIEPWRIEFVERIGTSIASTISAFMTGRKTGRGKPQGVGRQDESGNKEETRHDAEASAPARTDDPLQEPAQPGSSVKDGAGTADAPPGENKKKTKEDEIRKKLEELLKKKKPDG